MWWLPKLLSNLNNSVIQSREKNGWGRKRGLFSKSETWRAFYMSKLTGSPGGEEYAKSELQKVVTRFFWLSQPLSTTNLHACGGAYQVDSFSVSKAGPSPATSFSQWIYPGSKGAMHRVQVLLKWWSKVKQCLTFWLEQLCSGTLRSQKLQVCKSPADEQCQSLGITVIVL